MELVFLLEEQSAKDFLMSLLPKIIPSIEPIYLVHNGKGDLQKSIPIKLKGWKKPDTVFIILHDQDSNDCEKLKKKLQELCEPYSQRKYYICIACQELEAWYFGDWDAIEKVFPIAASHRNKTRYRKSDEITKPSKELDRITKNFSKIKAAKEIAQHFNLEHNQSPSFQYTLRKIQEATDYLV